MHAAIGGEQEAVKLLIFHVVVHDLPRRLFHIDVIRRVRQHKVCPLPIHQAGVNLFAGTVSANDTMPSKTPEVPQLRKARLLEFLIHIKVVFFDLLVIDVGKKLIHFRCVKAGIVKVIIRVLQIGQKVSQHLFIPFASDLVKRDIQSLLPGLVHIDYRAGYLGVAKLHGNRQSLVSADNGHIAINHQRVGKTKLFNGLFDLFVFLISRLQLFPGVILRRLQHRDRQHFQFRCLHFAPP